MGLTRKELDKVYEEVRSRYKRRNNRDLEIVTGINILYNALDDYINGLLMERYGNTKSKRTFFLF